jgi:hypothetical protein
VGARAFHALPKVRRDGDGVEVVGDAYRVAVSGADVPQSMGVEEVMSDQTFQFIKDL